MDRSASPQAGQLSSSMASLITVLLSFLGVILLVCHVNRHILSVRKDTDSSVDERLKTAIGTGMICLFLAMEISQDVSGS